MRMLIKSSALMALPVLLLAAAAMVTAGTVALTHPAQVVLPNLPYLVAALGGVMGWWFNRSQAVFALVLMVWVYGVMDQFVTQAPGADVLGQVLYAGLAVLVPINLTVVAFYKERGVLTGVGLSRLALIGLQAGLLCVAALGPLPDALHTWLADILHARALSKDIDAWTWLPQPALIAYILAVVIITGRLVVTRAPVGAGLLGALLASAAALHMVGQGAAPALFMTVAGLILTAAVVQDSYRMAFLDELTGLPARRALMGRFAKLGGTYTVAMVDVDHFKNFNDTYGHDVGDQVLQMVAGRLERVSGGGKSYRYGGEEFTVVFPGRDVEGATPHLEALRESIADAAFRLRSKDRPSKKPTAKGAGEDDAQTVSVTVSIGVAQRGPDLRESAAILKAADEALYRAKDGGRNQVSE